MASWSRCGVGATFRDSWSGGYIFLDIASGLASYIWTDRWVCLAGYSQPWLAMCVSMARWQQPPERGALNENETRKGAKGEPDKWAQEDEPPDARMQVPL